MAYAKQFIQALYILFSEEEGKKVLEEVKAELLSVAESKFTQLSIEGSPSSEDASSVKDEDDGASSVEQPCSPQV